MNIRKGDNVIVISGKDKGKEAKVVKVFPKELKLVLEGVNIKKKAQKARKSGQKGQIIEIAHPVNASNVMLIDPKSKKKTRVGYEVKDGKKIRIAKKSGAAI